MNYKRLYDLIIERGQTRILSDYSEEHHIIPRCLGGSDDAINLVRLTAEEHYVAHQLLVKIYPGHFGLLSASMFMTGGNEHRISNKVYAWLKKRYSTYMKGPNNPGKNQPTGEDHWKYGTSFDKSTWTPAGIKAMSESKTGDKNPMFGVKPWNHGRATEYTKSIWIRADEIYRIWLANNQPSYAKLYSLMNGKSYGRDWEAIGPYMNMIKYFRNGWIPTEDLQWKEFKDKE
jgi:hypothetical protein